MEITVEKFLLCVAWAATILITLSVSEMRHSRAVATVEESKSCKCPDPLPCPAAPVDAKVSKVVPVQVSTNHLPDDLAKLDPAFDSCVFHNGRTECEESLFFKLAMREKTSKVTMHAYQIPYAQWLTPRRLEPLNFLEIGLFGGASMRVWDEFFPNAKIFGTDIKADIDAMKRRSQRLQLYRGDQKDCPSLKKVVEAAGGHFDIIIDDGGHGMDMQQISFACLFPYLSDGGLYFIEDLQTSYSPDYNRLPGWNITTNIMKGFVDVIQRSWRDHPWEIEETHAQGVDHLMQSMHVYNNLVLFVKGKIHQRWNDKTKRWNKDMFPEEEHNTLDNIHNYWNKQQRH